jgi:hypothetical protein
MVSYSHAVYRICSHHYVWFCALRKVYNRGTCALPAGSGSLSAREEYDEYRSPSRSPAQPRHNHAAVAAAEQRVHAIQEAAVQMASVPPATRGFAWVGGSTRKGSNSNAAGATGARAPSGAYAHVNGSSPAHTDGAGTSSDTSPLPTKVVATGLMASSSRSVSGPSTSHAPFHRACSPASPPGQHANYVRERSPSPAAMDPPPRRPAPQQQAQKPTLASRKRHCAAHPPVNAQFKRPNRQ